MSCHVICSWVASLEMETSTTDPWQVHATTIECNVWGNSQSPIYTILLIKRWPLCHCLRKAPSPVTSAGGERSDVAGSNLTASVVLHEKKHVNTNYHQHYHIPKSWKLESKNWNALSRSYKYRQRKPKGVVDPRNLGLLNREVGFHQSPFKAWKLMIRDLLLIMGQQAFSICRMPRRTDHLMLLCRIHLQVLMANV